jgi:uncharacterized protein (DUF1330 family)
MAAYIIVDVEVTDPELYEEYKLQVPATLAAHGGRFLSRGGDVERLEGDWEPARVVVLQFESAEQARRWWASSEYAEPKAMRQRSARSNMILVEGVD